MWCGVVRHRDAGLADWHAPQEAKQDLHRKMHVRAGCAVDRTCCQQDLYRARHAGCPETAPVVSSWLMYSRKVSSLMSESVIRKLIDCPLTPAWRKRPCSHDQGGEAAAQQQTGRLGNAVGRAA